MRENEDRLYRAILEVEEGPRDGRIVVRVPSMGDDRFEVLTEGMREEVFASLRPEGYVIAKVTLNAPRERMRIESFEVAPEPSEELKSAFGL